MKSQGRYVLVGGAIDRLLRVMVFGGGISKVTDRQVMVLSSQPNQHDLMVLQDWLAAGKIRPYIDRSYSLREIPAALRYSEEGRVKGKITIRVADVNGASWPET